MLDEWMLLKGDETPPGSAPPVFTPPDVPSFMLAPQQVIVTQPTPSVEHGPPIGTKCLLLYTLQKGFLYMRYEWLLSVHMQRPTFYLIHMYIYLRKGSRDTQSFYFL